MALFSKAGKLRREYDERLIRSLESTGEDWHRARRIEQLTEEYDLGVLARRKVAESIHFYLYAEAKVRNIRIR